MANKTEVNSSGAATIRVNHVAGMVFCLDALRMPLKKLLRTSVNAADEIPSGVLKRMFGGDLTAPQCEIYLTGGSEGARISNADSVLRLSRTIQRGNILEKSRRYGKRMAELKKRLRTGDPEKFFAARAVFEKEERAQERRLSELDILNRQLGRS